MKSLLRVTVFVIAIMIAGTGAMAAEYLFAFKATPMDSLNQEIGTFLQGETFSVTAWVENYRDFANWEIKINLRGKRVSDALKVQDVFDSSGTWTIEFEIIPGILPEGSYVVTFQFREQVRGAKWQKLICRFQIVGTQYFDQALKAGPAINELFKVRKVTDSN